MKWVEVGIRIFPLIVGAVTAVEKIFRQAPAEPPLERHKRKQDAAVEAVGAMLMVIEAGAARDLLDDAEVQAAVRAAIDTYVALQNAIASAKARAAVDAPPS